jgi:tyrosyl-tRNA synthetase
MDKIEEILNRGTANVIPSKEALEKELKSERKLNIYLGIDPTFTELHLGNAVALRKIQQFADAGHNVTFLIGDYTCLIGDTSDKESLRPALSIEQINENFKTYKKQAEKILDFSKVKVRYNSEWLSKLNYEEIIKLTRHFTLGDFISRELIKKRLNEGKTINLSEVLYPVAQGYDSYCMDTDVQVGGTDQTFNIQAGRTLQKNLKGKESFCLTVPIMEGTDGRKMSKSYGNAIWLDDTPSNMYAKTMAINDNLIITYFELATNVPMTEVKNIRKEVELDPMNTKKKLAFEIVKELHSEKDAKEAEENFKKTIQNKELPDEFEDWEITGNIGVNPSACDVVSNYVKSRSEAKRLIEQGGVTIDGKKITDVNSKIKLEKGQVLKIGKRKYIKHK